jgi:nickel/cobalt transporter (NicO) family protein
MFRQRLVDLLRYGRGLQHTHDHDHHEHEHDHIHVHEHAGHSHGHGAQQHSHTPAGDQALTLRGLLALGVSGGLLPCPSALVVMLGAIALHRVAFGMLLIVAFSLGLAGVLTGIGLLLVYAQRWFERFPGDGRLIRAVSVGSAAVVTAAGLVISAGALAQLGLLG